ncbi:MAG: TMEM175 family protein [Peptoniphilus sp.]|nr:TMEM175 family protein [Peptoniphilus sp.]MDD7362664.1 TMEM175 family protein [Bacillota bacterium]MDY6044937.1 TMEM175 family protein [Peptoniphilus sp.]
MKRDRMEAFSDGILAIIITIMVLDLDIPKDASAASLAAIFPNFLAYILSYLYIGIYWLNHHHLVSLFKYVTTKLLWKNLIWVFCISLIPISTKWVGMNPMQGLPTLTYGAVLLSCATSYHFLQNEVTRMERERMVTLIMVGDHLKTKVSIVAYIVAVLLAMQYSIVAYFIYLMVALMWFIPDTSLEKWHLIEFMRDDRH